MTNEAASVAHDAKERGRDVAHTATEEAKDVGREAKTQLMQFLEQLRSEARTQASDQSRRAAQGLHSVGSELDQMATSSPSDGLATDLVRQAADRVTGAAKWFDSREPDQMLDEVRDFARRRPGTFLAGAAVLGIVGGRLTRGLADGSSGNGSSTSLPPRTGQAGLDPRTAPGGPAGHSTGASSTLSDSGVPNAATGTYGVSERTAPGWDTGDAGDADPRAVR